MGTDGGMGGGSCASLPFAAARIPIAKGWAMAGRWNAKGEGLIAFGICLTAKPESTQGEDGSKALGCVFALVFDIATDAPLGRTSHGNGCV